MPKKEASRLQEQLADLQRTLGGMRRMRRLPGALFVIDPHREKIAVTEARKLEIPVVGTGDTNVDPDDLDYIIPANDDAIRAIRLLCSLVADAAGAGLQERAARQETEAAAVEEEEEQDVGASEELLAALGAGGALTFEPEPDEEEELLPARGVEPEAAARPEPRAARPARTEGGEEEEEETPVEA